MDGLFINEIAIKYAWCWKGIRYHRYFCFVFCVVHTWCLLTLRQVLVQAPEGSAGSSLMKMAVPLSDFLRSKNGGVSSP